MALLRNDRNLKVSARAPERSHLALFRVVPWLRPAPSRDPAVEMQFNSPTPGQNGFEVRAVSLAVNLMWMFLLTSAIWHLFEVPGELLPVVFILSSVVVFPLALAIMVLAEPIARFTRRIGRSQDDSRIHAMVHHAVLLFAAVEAALDSHWIRWAGLIWLGLVATELCAWLIELALVRGKEGPSAS